MVKFKCGQCGQKIGVPEAQSGKRGKCPKCGAVASIPAPAPAFVAAYEDPPSDALAELAQQVETRPRSGIMAAASELTSCVSSPGNLFVEEPPLTVGERMIIRWAIAAGACLGVILIAVLVIPGWLQTWREDRLLTTLDAECASLIARAESDAAIFEFDGASMALDDAQRQVLGASLSAERVRAISEKIDAARQTVYRSRGDYNQKLATGYVLRSGVLVSPHEQVAEAARLEEEQQRRQSAEEERRREAAEAVRLAEAKQRKEEQRRQLTNDPEALAEDFEQFVRRLATVLKHEPDDAVFFDVRFDLRKTDSLVNPYVAVVEWREVFRNTIRNGEYAFYKHAIVHFGLKDGKWTPKSYSQGTYGHGRLVGEYKSYDSIPKFVSTAAAKAQ